MYAHETNLMGKIEKNYNDKQEELQFFLNNVYMEYRIKLENIFLTLNVSTSEFQEAAKLINEYLLQLDIFSNTYKISSQSKFRSSFLEEMNTYFFKNLIENETPELSMYNKGIYAGLKIANDMKINILTKDVDFCIGKKVKLNIDNEYVSNIIIPVIAVEVKTYLDATMFGEVQYSARQIKNSTPNAKTYVIMEDNQVSKEKILAARNDNTINEMFVFRGKKENKNFDMKVLSDYYYEIRNSIKNIKVDDEIVIPGRLINIL